MEVSIVQVKISVLGKILELFTLTIDICKSRRHNVYFLLLD